MRVALDTNLHGLHNIRNRRNKMVHFVGWWPLLLPAAPPICTSAKSTRHSDCSRVPMSICQKQALFPDCHHGQEFLKRWEHRTAPVRYHAIALFANVTRMALPALVAVGKLLAVIFPTSGAHVQKRVNMNATRLSENVRGRQEVRLENPPKSSNEPRSVSHTLRLLGTRRTHQKATGRPLEFEKN